VVLSSFSSYPFKIFPDIASLPLLLEFCTHRVISVGQPLRGTQGRSLFWSDWREGAVLFVTYQWGNPQLDEVENAEGVAIPC
jgi:hypothetical protein